MSFGAITVLTLLLLYVFVAGGRFGHLSPISLFIYSQAVMALGTFPMLAPGSPADATHARVLTSTFAILALFATVYGLGLLRAPRSDYAPEVDFAYPSKSVRRLIWLSVAVCAAYYFAVGYFALFESLRALVQGSDVDLAGLRLESYAGSRYLFPGYVNQFKNSLLPALTIVVISGVYAKRTRWRATISVLLAATAILFLLGTGQRGAFVSSGIMAAVAVYLIAPRLAPKAISRLALVVIPIFFFSTFASGRAARELDAAQNPLDVMGVMFNQLAFRLLGSNQLSSTVGFRYVHDLDIVWGAEWWQSLLGLLPGHQGSDLSNRVFEVLYGSTRGTAPLSIWGSAYHNLGFVGTLLYATLLAGIFCWLSRKINDLKRTNLVQLVGAAGMTVSLGVWLAGSPDAVLNQGLAVFVILWVWGGRIRRAADVAGEGEAGRRTPPRSWVTR